MPLLFWRQRGKLGCDRIQHGRDRDPWVAGAAQSPVTGRLRKPRDTARHAVNDGGGQQDYQNTKD